MFIRLWNGMSATNNRGYAPHRPDSSAWCKGCRNRFRSIAVTAGDRLARSPAPERRRHTRAPGGGALAGRTAPAPPPPGRTRAGPAARVGAAHGPTRPTDSTGCSLICCSGCLILVGTRRRPERLRAAMTPGQYPERRPLRIGCSGSPHTSYAGRRVYVCWLPGYSGLSFVGFDLFPRRRRRTTWRVACSARTSTMVRVRDVTTTSATCLSVIVLGRSFVPSGPALPSYWKCARLVPDFS